MDKSSFQQLLQDFTAADKADNFEKLLQIGTRLAELMADREYSSTVTGLFDPLAVKLAKAPSSYSGRALDLFSNIIGRVRPGSTMLDSLGLMVANHPKKAMEVGLLLTRLKNDECTKKGFSIIDDHLRSHGEEMVKAKMLNIYELWPMLSSPLASKSQKSTAADVYFNRIEFLFAASADAAAFEGLKTAISNDIPEYRKRAIQRILTLSKTTKKSSPDLLEALRVSIVHSAQDSTQKTLIKQWNKHLYHLADKNIDKALDAAWNAQNREPSEAFYKFASEQRAILKTMAQPEKLAQRALQGVGIFQQRRQISTVRAGFRRAERTALRLEEKQRGEEEERRALLRRLDRDKPYEPYRPNEGHDISEGPIIRNGLSLDHY